MRKSLTEKMHPLIVGPYDVAVRGLAPGSTAARDRRGDYSPSRLEIRIVAGQPLTVERETIVHELLHALWHDAGLPAQYEEKVVSALSPRLVAVCRANGKLREVLFP
jgi:hypothetical protein